MTTLCKGGRAAFGLLYLDQAEQIYEYFIQIIRIEQIF